MEQIYPLHEENIKRFCGMPVCVVTNEGQRHYGILSRCHEGRIVLNERPATADGQVGGHAASGVQKGKVTNQKNKKLKKGKAAAAESKTTGAAQTQAYYPYDPYGYYGDWYGGFGFGGEVLAFDLAALAFLFLLI